MNDPYTDNPYPEPRIINLADYGAERFVGEPPPVEWLVTDTVPKGAPTVIAAPGDTGKGYKILEIGFKVAAPPEPTPFKCGDDVINLNYCLPVLGGTIAAHGTAVIIAGEDSEATLHRRLNAIDPDGRRHKHPGKLRLVALPDTGGPLPLFVQDHNGVKATEHWTMICDQLIKISDLQMVAFDPLSNFAQVQLDSDNTASQAVMGSFTQLGAETGAAVILPHHMRKLGKSPESLAEVRDAIRGASGIVDGGRCAYAMWPAEEKKAQKVCEDLGVAFLPNRVVYGAVVKTNDNASREMRIFVRSEQGLLVDRTSDVRSRRPSNTDLWDALVEAVRKAAAETGLPFNKTGKAGLYEQRHRLPESLQGLGRDRLQALCQELIEQDRIVQCKAPGSNIPQWLDVPGGPFARGEGQFVQGAAT